MRQKVKNQRCRADLFTVAYSVTYFLRVLVLPALDSFAGSPSIGEGEGLSINLYANHFLRKMVAQLSAGVNQTPQKGSGKNEVAFRQL
jgi:hypothetical protein